MSRIRIAIVKASWHSDLVDRIELGFNERLAELGHSHEAVEVHTLPGALEFPLHCKRLAKTGRFDAIVAMALVVDGGIYRHEFVANAVIHGMMNVMLETEVPIMSAVLTPQQFHEHDIHHGFFHQHLVEKGREAANAAVATVSNLEAVG